MSSTPIQMTVATSDGESIWAFRYSSEGSSRSLHFSTRMDALKANYPDSEALAALSDETRWWSPSRWEISRAPGTRCRNHVGMVRPGDDERGRFPRRP